MSAQDAKKKDSKPQPSENEKLRAAMVVPCPSLPGCFATRARACSPQGMNSEAV